jgi:methylmalonyl-CoA mutase
VLAIDNTLVRQSQIKRLQQVRATRDAQKVQESLDKLTECARTGKGNLLELSIEASYCCELPMLDLLSNVSVIQAARARCTVGEISYALEKVWGRHEPVTRVVSGAYKTEYGDHDEIQATIALIEVRKA